MIREQFLSMKIPIYPYCNIHRGPGTKYNESIHLKFPKDIQINIFWRCDGDITIGTFDGNEINPYKKTQTIEKGKLSTKKILQTLKSIMNSKGLI